MQGMKGVYSVNENLTFKEMLGLTAFLAHARLYRIRRERQVQILG